MKIINNLKVAVLVAALNIPAILVAGDVSKCDAVAERVRQAVEKEPNKVLVFVEDFMVSDEACACEIVKSAVLASKATPDLVKQIVVTATNVAPKYGAIIAECANAITPRGEFASNDGGKGVVGGKDSVGVQPAEGVQPVTSGGGGSSGTDYRAAPYDIRGVYLIQPATAGVVTTTTETSTSSKTIIVKRTPPRRSVPQSPSVANGP